MPLKSLAPTDQGGPFTLLDPLQLPIGIGARDGEAAFRRVQGTRRPDPVNADVPGSCRQEPCLDLDIGPGAPARIEDIAGDPRLLVGLAHPEMPAVVAEGEHAIQSGAFVDALVALHAEGIAGGIDELGIFLAAEPHLEIFLAGRQARRHCPGVCIITMPGCG